MAKHKRLTNRQFRRLFKEFKVIMEIYSKTLTKNLTDWKGYEKEYAEQIRYVAREPNSLAKSAVYIIHVNISCFGRPAKLSLQQKVVALLLKSIF